MCNCSTSVGGAPFEVVERLHKEIVADKDNEIKTLKAKLATCAPCPWWSIAAWCALFAGIGALAVYVAQCGSNVPPRLMHSYGYPCCVEDGPYYPRYK